MTFHELCVEYDEKWEQARDKYPPDPAAKEFCREVRDTLELIRELEKITKRTT